MSSVMNLESIKKRRRLFGLLLLGELYIRLALLVQGKPFKKRVMTPYSYKGRMRMGGRHCPQLFIYCAAAGGGASWQITDEDHMPIYEYQCEACDHKMEKLQKLSDEPLKVCPACDEAKLNKLVSAAGFRLKGGGWYETDFKTGNKKNVAGDSHNPTSSSGSSDSGSDSGSGSGSDTSSKSSSSSSTSSSSSSSSKPSTPAAAS